ncbi:endoglucanase [Xylanibacillus composti]|uniref:cellulase n=1 Tax=Xylanibacillus composti TaxID=1572762 RepID=A0A8J4H5C4_9BACL|nr:carbohydrate-binding domain-containing protein [Xylanibacillus composti]MDT9725025.1 endoglucanase [Xylanibacillus composti]GIQ69811.1 hypothetical protein XYCOK13_26350 [Xylanibacillus composti]
MNKNTLRKMLTMLMVLSMVATMFAGVAVAATEESSYDPVESEAERPALLGNDSVKKPSEAGKLQVIEIDGQMTLADEAGNKIQLRGMSTHGLQWFPEIVNDNAFAALANDWESNVIRLAMYVGEGGYATKPSVKDLVIDGIEFAFAHDMYVIVDWHVHAPGDPNEPVYAGAYDFFEELADTYKDHPKFHYIIWELANEPSSNNNGGKGLTNDEAGWQAVKSYAEPIVDMLREKGDNIIIVGSPNWSQRPDLAADNPIASHNIVYTVHFYSGTHGASDESYPPGTPSSERGNVMSNARYALEKGVAVFVSEWGTSEASGDNGPYLAEADVWLEFLNENNISWVNWSLTNKNETSGAFVPFELGKSQATDLDPGEDQVWVIEELSASGEYMRARIKGIPYRPIDRNAFSEVIWDFNDGTTQGFGVNSDSPVKDLTIENENDMLKISGMSASNAMGDGDFWSNVRISSDGYNPEANILGAKEISIDVTVEEPTAVGIAAIPQNQGSWVNPVKQSKIAADDFVEQDDGTYKAVLTITAEDSPAIQAIGENIDGHILNNLILFVAAEDVDVIYLDNITFSGSKIELPVVHAELGEAKLPSDFEDGTRQNWVWHGESGVKNALTIEEANGSKALSWEFAYPEVKPGDGWASASRLDFWKQDMIRSYYDYVVFDLYLKPERATEGSMSINLVFQPPSAGYWAQATDTFTINFAELERATVTEDGLYHYLVKLDLHSIGNITDDMELRNMLLIFADGQSDFAGRLYLDNIRFEAATQEEENTMQDTARLQIGFSGNDTYTSVTRDVYLPTKGQYGSTITWASSNENIISTSGVVTRPSVTTDVYLTATVTQDVYAATKRFDLTVLRASRGGGGSGGGPIGGGGSVDEDAVVITNPNAVNGVIAVTIAQGKKKVLLPANAAAINRGNKLKIDGEDFTIQIPGSVLEQLKALLNDEELANAQIAFEFDEVAEEDQTQLLERAKGKNKAGLKAASTVYSFTLSIVKGDGVIALADFEEPLSLTLRVKSGHVEDLLGMYFLANDGTLEYAGGALANNEMTAEIAHFSTYAVLEYDKIFDDVSADYWAADVIKRMAAKHIVAGISVDEFAPRQNVTRAEFAALIVRALGLEARGQAPFADVDASRWYAEAVAAAYEAGIVSGRSATEFAPHATITRQEMALMIVKAYEHKTGETLRASTASSFEDSASISEWARAAVGGAAELGLLQGRGNNQFVPQGVANRAESVQVIAELLKK